MKFTLLAIAALLAFTYASDLVILDDNNIESYVKENDFVFVKFYAPWCGHCKKMAAEWEKLATKLKESPPAQLEGLNVKIAEFDATQGQKPKTLYEVKGFPTIRLFKKGTPLPKYQGARTIDDFTNYLVQEIVKTEL